MHVLIIGGGIGGLATALSLQKAGIEATVFEAVPEIRPLGVGINMLPHAVRELTELGLQDELAAVGIKTRELVYANRHGQQIWQEDRGLHAGYNWPQFSIARGALQMILLEAARARLGDERIVSDHELMGFEQSGDKVTAHFRQRSTGETLEYRHRRCVDRGGWHSFSCAAPFLSGRRRPGLERLRALAGNDGRGALPVWPLDGDGRSRRSEIRLLPDQPCRGTRRPLADQLDCGAPNSRSKDLAARRLEPHGRHQRVPLQVRKLGLRLDQGAGHYLRGDDGL